MESSGDCEFMGHFKFSSPGAKKRRSGAGYVTPSASSGGSLSSGDTEPVVDPKYSAKLLESFMVGADFPAADCKVLGKSLVAALPLASMWKKLSAERLVYKPTKLKSDPGIEGITFFTSNVILEAICLGLEKCDLMSSESRYATIGGSKPVATDWVAISERLDKVPNCPVLPSGSAAGHFVPTSIVFGQFVQKLNSFLSSAPGLSAVVQEVFKTPYCGSSDVTRWMSALTPDGNKLLYAILVNRCSMGSELQAQFKQSLHLAQNGLAMWQNLCAAVSVYTPHTVYVNIQVICRTEPVPSPHKLKAGLEALIEVRDKICSMGCGLDDTTLEFMMLGALKALISKCKDISQKVEDMELEQGCDIDINDRCF